MRFVFWHLINWFPLPPCNLTILGIKWHEVTLLFLLVREGAKTKERRKQQQGLPGAEEESRRRELPQPPRVHHVYQACLGHLIGLSKNMRTNSTSDFCSNPCVSINTCPGMPLSLMSLIWSHDRSPKPSSAWTTEHLPRLQAQAAIMISYNTPAYYIT